MSKRIQKHSAFGRTLREYMKNGRMKRLHATKGCRSNREPQPTVNVATKLIDRFYGKELV